MDRWHSNNIEIKDGCSIYVDVMTEKICCQFRLLTLTSFIGQFVHSLVEEGKE